jgi:serine/threonine-protein kinase RsbW
MPSSLDLQMPNELSALDAVVQRVSALITECGADSAALFAANLALEELITNILKYGYDDQEKHWIGVRVETGGDRFHLEISDDGHPFNPFELAPPDTTLPMEERQIGGLGIHFVRSMLDECLYERRDGMNVVRVSKRLRSEAL